jgi:hypothetical protein
MSGKKKTYVVMHPDGTWSKRVSVKDTVYTAAIVQVVRLAVEHEYLNVKGARDSRLLAAKYRATAKRIRGGEFYYYSEAPAFGPYTNYKYATPDRETIDIRAIERAEADAMLAAKADDCDRWAENADRVAAEKEVIPAPPSDAIEYGRHVEYRTDPRAAESEVDRRNAAPHPVWYYHVAGVHLVPDGTTAKKYAESLQVPF